MVILRGMLMSTISHSEEGLKLRPRMKPQRERPQFGMEVWILPLSELGIVFDVFDLDSET